MTVDAIEQRIAVLARSPEYRVYEDVRREVYRLREQTRDRMSGAHAPSEYWEEELSNFDYLFDASPLIVHKLRQHSFHVTGLKVYEYRSHRDAARRQFAEKLDALVRAAGGRELLVPETPMLGGFGHDIDGDLYNIDTLKFFEVMIALQKGAVLDELRRMERPVVWEIGAGWGGFAYVLRTLLPQVKCVLTDFPELFLFSATYLQVAFPDARVHFFDPEADEPMGPPEADFVFVPNAFLAETRPERLDLAINMVSFQEMTSEQVRQYVRHAFELEAPYLYSLNRNRSPYNPQLTSVREIIAETYWPQEISVLPGVQYTQMLPKPPVPTPTAKRLTLKALDKSKTKTKKPDLGYKHVIGWRRRPA